MHPLIQKILDLGRDFIPLKNDAFVDFYLACFAYMTLSKAGKLDDQQAYSDKTSVEKLITVLNDCTSVHFTHDLSAVKDENLNVLLKQVNDLFDAKVITPKDLSLAAKEMLQSSRADFSIPDELCYLGVSLLGDTTDSVYCPFEKGSEFAFHLPKSTSAKAESCNIRDVFYAEVQGILLDRSLDIVASDPINSPHYIGDGGLQQFDSSIAIPPFGLRMPKKEMHDIWDRFPEKSMSGDVYFLRHMLAHSSKKVVCFVSNALLFRTAAGEKEFKQNILKENWLDVVIALPSGLLSHTNIPISVLVFDKTKADRNIKFIDASGKQFAKKTSKTSSELINVDRILETYYSKIDSEISATCSEKDIAKIDYNLSPSRYVISDDDKKLQRFLEKFELTKLSDLAEIVRPQALMHEESGTSEYKEYGLTNLNGIRELSGEGKCVKVSVKNESRADKQIIKPKDILVVCRGAVGTVGFVPGEVEVNAIANQAFAIVRIKSHINNITPEALFQYLSSEYGMHQLSALATGTSSLMLASKDLSSLAVPIFTQIQQQNLAEVRQKVKEKHDKIQSLKKEVATLQADFMKVLG